MKQYYIKELINWIIDQPFDQSGSIDCISREDSFIDLAVLSGKEVNREWLNSDREAIMKLEYLQQESIGINDIWEPTDQLVFVRGVAGIGKSTLINRYVLKWAKNEILNDDDDSRIDFLLLFECRELNTLTNIHNLEELIRSKYPQIFHSIAYTDFQTTANRVMIIVDGLDELKGIYDDNNEEPSPMRELVKSMIDTKSSILNGHTTIACGRPNACEFVKSTLVHSQNVKTIEVCGFDRTKSIEYIERFFNGNSEKAEKVKGILKQPNIRFMSSIPVLLWIICSLYAEDFQGEITSTTELYTYGLLVFLKKHLHHFQNFEHQNLSALVKTKEFGEIIYSLARLSVKTYMNNQVVFTDNDIKSIKCPIHLEQTGFIVKHSTGMLGTQVYQFKHLIFQEYLCALFLYLAKGVSKYNTNRELKSCTPTIIGLHHLVMEQNNKLFTEFYGNLKSFHLKKQSLSESVKAPYKHLIHKRFLEEHLNARKLIENHVARNNAAFECYSDDFDFKELMRISRMNRWLFDEKLLEEVRKYEILVSTGGSMSQQVLEFVESWQLRITLLAVEVNDSFGKANLELLKLTNTCQTLHVEVSSFFSRKWYLLSNQFRTDIVIDYNFSQKCLPIELKKHFKTFALFCNSSLEGLWNRDNANVFIFVADLVEYVLEQNGNNEEKELIIGKYTIPEIFEQKIRDEFGHREHFNKIVFEE